MATPFLGLRTVVYYVSDVAKARDWYAGVLGIQPYFDEPFYVGFTVGGYELGLHPIDKATEINGKYATVYWGVEDVAATYASLLAAGATPYEEPENVGGDIVVAAVKDPWGNAFGLIYNPHFKLG